jgi:hypothetical protein
MTTVGSILHGAYGDYYEQMVCLRDYKRRHPGTRLVLFFADEYRRSELSVLDLSFADEVHPASDIAKVPVEQFFQFQVRDDELQETLLSRLPEGILAQLDVRRNRLPWAYLRRALKEDARAGDLGLGPHGRERLPACLRDNGVDETLFGHWFTVGFLWRYRPRSGSVSPFLQASEDTLLRTKSELLGRLIADYGAHVFVCGMNVQTTAENRRRIDAKYTAKQLTLPPTHCTYLKGLSWGLELEILRRCTLCLVMASGFSEALWLKRRSRTVLLDPPLHYLARLTWHRMPLFSVLRPAELVFQLRQPHTAGRVIPYLLSRSLLPPHAGVSSAPGSNARCG